MHDDSLNYCTSIPSLSLSLSPNVRLLACIFFFDNRRRENLRSGAILQDLRLQFDLLVLGGANFRFLGIISPHATIRARGAWILPYDVLCVFYSPATSSPSVIISCINPAGSFFTDGQ
jgi:hypothetical protein